MSKGFAGISDFSSSSSLGINGDDNQTPLTSRNIDVRQRLKDQGTGNAGTETIKIPVSSYYNYVMMLRPFYRKQDHWSCGDIIQCLSERYEGINIAEQPWFSQDAVNCLIRGCRNWDEVESSNYFVKQHKELNPFNGTQGESHFGWRTNRCERAGDTRYMISVLSDYAIKIIAQFIYPMFDDKFTEDMVEPALASLGINSIDVIIEKKQIFLALLRANKILSNPEAYVEGVRKRRAEKEKQENEKIRLRKARKNKFWTMFVIALMFYIISCFMCSTNGKEGAFGGCLIWGVWAIIEIVILSTWDVKSEATKLEKIYAVFSFLSVPIIAFLFAFLFQAYKDKDFLHLTMVLLSPVGYVITWIVFFVHVITRSYINGPDKL